MVDVRIDVEVRAANVHGAHGGGQREVQPLAGSWLLVASRCWALDPRNIKISNESHYASCGCQAAWINEEVQK